MRELVQSIKFGVTSLKKYLWIFLIVCASFFSTGAQAQDVTNRTCTPDYTFCDACSTTVTLLVKRNKTCVLRFYAIGGLFGMTLQRPPTHGAYRTSTGGELIGAYIPERNYVGSDYFETRIDYGTKTGRRTYTILKASVRVVDQATP